MIRVLHVEDDELDRRAVRRVLGTVTELVQVETMAQGLDFARSQRWGLILLDHQLPDHAGHPGPVMRAAVRAVAPKGAPDTPIVILTGSDESQLVDIATTGGPWLVLSKARLAQEAGRSTTEQMSDVLTPLLGQMTRVFG